MISNGDVQPLIIVLPDVNHPIPLNDVYRKYVVEDIIGFIDRTYRTIPDRKSRIIAGHSYSGGEALFIAAGNPTIFSFVGIYSANFFETLPNAKIFINHDQQTNPLFFWISMGRKDEFPSQLQYTRNVIKILDEIGLPYEYTEDDSDHWTMIGQRIEESIKYFSRDLVYDRISSGAKNWSLLNEKN